MDTEKRTADRNKAHPAMRARLALRAGVFDSSKVPGISDETGIHATCVKCHDWLPVCCDLGCKSVYAEETEHKQPYCRDCCSFCHYANIKNNAESPNGMVSGFEPDFVKKEKVRSLPRQITQVWCSGNTIDFQSVFTGSSPVTCLEKQLTVHMGASALRAGFCVCGEKQRSLNIQKHRDFRHGVPVPTTLNKPIGPKAPVARPEDANTVAKI